MRKYKKVHLSQDSLQKHVAQLKAKNAKIISVQNVGKTYEIIYSFPYNVKVDETNFHRKTTAKWEIVAVRKGAYEKFNELVKKYGLNHKSPAGSKYVTTQKGVYRFSDHWGNVATCSWDLNNGIPKWMQREKAYILAYVPFNKMTSKLKKEVIIFYEFYHPQRGIVKNGIEKDLLTKDKLKELKKNKNFKIIEKRIVIS
jgi:hypothetical protein